MNKSLPRCLFVYGAFLILAGIAGFLSNPEKAKTALLSGGTFGLLSIGWGVLCARGVAWGRRAAFATMAFLAVVFLWRAAVGWMAVMDGRQEKLFTACLISLMLASTVLMLSAMLRKKI